MRTTATLLPLQPLNDVSLALVNMHRHFQMIQLAGAACGNAPQMLHKALAPLDKCLVLRGYLACLHCQNKI